MIKTSFDFDVLKELVDESHYPQPTSHSKFLLGISF